MPTCAHCATPVPEDARYCHSCGSQVSDAEGQAAATAAMDNAAFLHMESLIREETTGEFEIERMLGRGGMAVVYLATEVHLSRKVAIKVLPPELTFGHGVERFKREAKTAAALDHPNIIPIYRVASGGKIFWYAMKYLEGRALDAILKEQQRFSLDETLDILGQVADALDYAHEHQVIHRDIKPANVMLDKRGRVVVTDFGIAKALTEGTLTASGSVIGTPYFMSPEQGMGKLVTGAADQYSVAVMAYRMLSGQVPFEGDSAIDILHKHCMVAPPPLETAAPGLPRHVYRAVHRGLEKEAERRFATVTAFVEALRRPVEATIRPGERTSDSEVATVVVPVQPDLSGAATAGGGRGAADSMPGRAQTAPSGVAHPPARAPQRSRRGRLVAAAAVVLVAGIAGVVALSGGDDSGQPTGGPGQGGEGEVQPATPTPPQAGVIDVRGLPAGGTVIWNGQEQTSRFEAPPGSTIVELRAPGYQNQQTPIVVESGVTTALPFTAQRVPDPVTQPAPQPARPTPNRPATPTPQRPAAPAMATFQIAVRPAAEVFIDGQSFGERTRLEHEVQAGIAHALRFVRPGFVTKDTVITATEGQTVRVIIRLESQ